MSSVTTSFPARSASKVESRSATIHLCQSTHLAQRLARWLLVGLVLSIFAMAFLPWQQTSRGYGQVVAYAPQERQQVVQAPAEGVVVHIAPELFEGAQVKEGQLLVELQPFAANKRQQLEGQYQDLKIKIGAARAEAKAYQDQIGTYEDARDYAVKAAELLIEATESKLQSEIELIPGYEAKAEQARLNLERQRELETEGLAATKEIEKLEKNLKVAESDLTSLHRKIDGLKQEVEAKKQELEEKRSDGQAKIALAVAKNQYALGSAASISKDIKDVEIKLQELDRLVIRASRDGTIFRMPIFDGLGQTVKKGDPILTLIPETSQTAVELYINGNDMPLVQKDQDVRLQFEGWPAVQFAGWPSVAVGTFGGTVASVDATDNGKGEFRVLIIPDAKEQDWPTDRFLRQGVRTNGWVMLRRVSLGFELWRQLNGFPKALTSADQTASEDKKDIKKPKLPK